MATGFTGAVGATGSVVYSPATGELVVDMAKTFVIDHPTNPEKYLVHGCLEGPEAGVYYRGTSKIAANDDETLITLPDYISALANNFTVHITPIGRHRPLGSSIVVDNKFTVYSDIIPKVTEFSWLVYATRSQIDVEPNKADVTLNGDGPYTWIDSDKKSTE